MESIIAGTLSALWLGILTSISPCPLATNIAAISYIGKRVDSPGSVLFSGMLYMIGRMLTYSLLGVILVAGLLSVFDIANFFQASFNKILGPILILTGIAIMGFLKIGSFGFSGSDKIQNRAHSLGIWGAGFLGIIFALSFCPISAALFFGSLIPLAAKYESGFSMPLLYGLGTGLPVALFAILLSFGARGAGKLFNKLTAVEKWARMVTGVIFIAIGIYYVLIYFFNIDLL